MCTQSSKVGVLCLRSLRCPGRKRAEIRLRLVAALYGQADLVDWTVGWCKDGMNLA